MRWWKKAIKTNIMKIRWKNNKGKTKWKNNKGKTKWKNNKGKTKWKNNKGKTKWKNNKDKTRWKNNDGRKLKKNSKEKKDTMMIGSELSAPASHQRLGLPVPPDSWSWRLPRPIRKPYTPRMRTHETLVMEIHILATDINKIGKDIKSMNPKSQSETEEILSDPAIMDALRCADRQYHEGKAIPLEDLMKELGFEEDEL